MKELTVRKFEISKDGWIDFVCVDEQEDIYERNFCKTFQGFNEEKQSAKEYHVYYNINDASERHLLLSMIKNYAPKAKNLTELVETIAAIGISENKPIPAYWSKNEAKWYFKY